MQRWGMMVGIMCMCIGVVVIPVLAQTLPGATVEERAINGAREYIKKHNLKEPALTMLMISLDLLQKSEKDAKT